MASIIFLNLKYQYNVKGSEYHLPWNGMDEGRPFVDFTGDSPKAIIAKGNIIEGIEARN